MVEAGELQKGMTLTVRQASNTISRVTHDITIDIVWIDGPNVHYRKTSFGFRGAVQQTPMERFLDIINNQPPERH